MWCGVKFSSHLKFNFSRVVLRDKFCTIFPFSKFLFWLKKGIKYYKNNFSYYILWFPPLAVWVSNSAPRPRYWCKASKVTLCNRIMTTWTTLAKSSGYFSKQSLKAVKEILMILVSSVALAETVLYIFWRPPRYSRKLNRLKIASPWPTFFKILLWT